MKSPFTLRHFLTPPSTEVSHLLAADTQLVECVGVNPSYKLGELRKDTGYQKVGIQIIDNSLVGGLFQFNQSATVQKILTTLNNSGSTGTELWFSTGANFSNIATAAWASAGASMRVEMEGFLGYAYFVGYNGSSFLPVATLTGTTFSTTTNTAGMAQAKYIERYRDRLYTANTKLQITTTVSNFLFNDVPVGYSYLPVASTTSFPESGVLTVGSDTITYSSKSPVQTVPSVDVGTDAALPANTYANGANGVGATITANAAGTLTVDGVIVNAGMRVLVKNEATTVNNGVYVCTTAGTAAVPFVLTRTVDSDEANELRGSVVHIIYGTANRGMHYRNTNFGALTVGISNITYGVATGTVAFYGIPLSGDNSINTDAAVGATVTMGSSTATPYRVYYSDIPVNNVVTWSPDTNFFDVDYSEEIVGVRANWDRLMVFTDRNTYMYDQNQLKQVFNVGAVNQRTIQNLEAYMIWLSSENVYVSVSGGRPQPIGNDILQLIRNATGIGTPADANKFIAEVVNNEYNLYLGATNANGISYTNCMATFNFDRGMWRWRELATEPRVMAWTTLIADKERLIFGNNDGTIFRKALPQDASYTDDSSSIRARFRTKAFDLGNPEILKAVTRILTYSRVPGRLEMRFRVFDKDTEANMPFTSLGYLSKAINIFDKRLDGHFIQFEGVDYGTTEGFVFEGLTMLATASSHQS